MSVMTDDELKEVARSNWVDDEESFKNAFPKMLPKLRAAEERSRQSYLRMDTTPAQVFSNQLGDILGEYSPSRIAADNLKRERESKDAEAREAKAGAVRAEKQAEFKRAALARYTAAGGDPKDFDAVFPDIWATHLRAVAAQASADDMEAKARTTALYRENA